MTTVSSSILIIRPIQEVFNYTIAPQNGPKFIPYLRENSNIEPIHSCLGQTFDWCYSMGGIEMKGKAKVVEYSPCQKYVLSTTGNILSTWTFLFEEVNKDVKVTLTIDYDFEQHIIQKTINRLILDKFNQRAVEEVLENLKAQLDTSSF